MLRDCLIHIVQANDLPDFSDDGSLLWYNPLEWPNILGSGPVRSVCLEECPSLSAFQTNFSFTDLADFVIIRQMGLKEPQAFGAVSDATLDPEDIEGPVRNTAKNNVFRLPGASLAVWALENPSKYSVDAAIDEKCDRVYSEFKSNYKMQFEFRDETWSNERIKQELKVKNLVINVSNSDENFDTVSSKAYADIVENIENGGTDLQSECGASWYNQWQEFSPSEDCSNGDIDGSISPAIDDCSATGVDDLKDFAEKTCSRRPCAERRSAVGVVDTCIDDLANCQPALDEDLVPLGTVGDKSKGINNAEEDIINNDWDILPEDAQTLTYLIRPGPDFLENAVVCKYFRFSSFWGKRDEDRFQNVDDFSTNYWTRLNYEEQKDALQLVKSEATEGCMPMFVPMNLDLSNRCLPRATKDFIDSIANNELFEEASGDNFDKDTIINALNSIKDVQDKGLRFASDLENVWPLLLITSLALTAVMSLLWILIMRFSAPFITWSTVLLVNLLMIGLTIVSGIHGGLFGSLSKEDLGGGLSEQLPNVDFDDEKAFKIIFYVLLGITVLMILTTLLSIRRIKVAIAMMRVASQSIGHNPGILFYIFVDFALSVALWAWIISVALYIAAAAKVDFQGENPQDSSWTGMRDWDMTLVGAIAYHIVGSFWGGYFLGGFTTLVIAGAVASFYWARGDPKATVASPVLKSVLRAIRYHMGSAALYGLLLTFLQILLIFARMLRCGGTMKSGNACTKCMACFCRSITFCFEVIVKVTSRKAMVMVANHGASFCPSANKVFSLLLQYAGTLTSVTLVGNFIVFLGRLLIAGVSGLVAGLIVENVEDLNVFEIFSDPGGKYFQSTVFLPAILCALASLIVSGYFFQLYNVAIDAVLNCYLHDKDLSPSGNAQYAPPYIVNAIPELQRLAQKKLNRKEDLEGRAQEKKKAASAARRADNNFNRNASNQNDDI